MPVHLLTCNAHTQHTHTEQEAAAAAAAAGGAAAGRDPNDIFGRVVRLANGDFEMPVDWAVKTWEEALGEAKAKEITARMMVLIRILKKADEVHEQPGAEAAAEAEAEAEGGAGWKDAWSKWAQDLWDSKDAEGCGLLFITFFKQIMGFLAYDRFPISETSLEIPNIRVLVLDERVHGRYYTTPLLRTFFLQPEIVAAPYVSAHISYYNGGSSHAIGREATAPGVGRSFERIGLVAKEGPLKDTVLWDQQPTQPLDLVLWVMARPDSNIRNDRVEEEAAAGKEEDEKGEGQGEGESEDEGMEKDEDEDEDEDEDGGGRGRRRRSRSGRARARARAAGRKAIGGTRASRRRRGPPPRSACWRSRSARPPRARSRRLRRARRRPRGARSRGPQGPSSEGVRRRPRRGEKRTRWTSAGVM